MPELPEVEAARQTARRVAVGRRIVRVWCADDPIVFDRVSPGQVKRALIGRRVVGVHRHGKHLWFELDRRPWPCLHFGMTGGFHVPGRKSVKLMSIGARHPRPDWPPRFAKLRLTFDDGGELVFADARRLGRVRLRHDPAAEPPISLLGFDALLGVPTPRKFAELLRGRSAPIKPCSSTSRWRPGWATGSPTRCSTRPASIPAAAPRRSPTPSCGGCATGSRSVVALAVRVGSDSDRFPRRWLFHDRWGKRDMAMTSAATASATPPSAAARPGSQHPALSFGLRKSWATAARPRRMLG
jgi:formamidopyrimidine-DNA glycosylase